MFISFYPSSQNNLFRALFISTIRKNNYISIYPQRANEKTKPRINYTILDFKEKINHKTIIMKLK